MTNEELVLSWLEDEESRFIFTKRVEYNKTHDFNVIREIVSAYLPQLWDKRYYPGIQKEIVDRVKDKRIALFGSGLNATTLMELLEKSECKVLCILDNNESVWGNQLRGVTIHNPDEMDYSEIDTIIVTPYKAEWITAIHKQLSSYGVEPSEIIDYRDYCPFMLEDEQYFDENIIHLQPEEVFIDGGVLDLETSLRFENFCRKSGTNNYKVYAFEPDPKSYMRCKGIVDRHPEYNIHLCNAGLWSSNTNLYFNGQGTGGSRIVEQETDNSIAVVSLDSCVNDRVTFIKMDIEGAEMEALKGAESIIKSQKPKLAICVYHKEQDMTEIPIFIKKLVPEYKLFMRHYSNDAGETVLYAV